MSAADWPDALVSGLSRDFHVLIPDNRDAGASPHWGPDHDCHALEQLALEALGKPFTAPFDLNSMRDDVIQLTETLGIQRYAILGFSMGGMIAQGVAAARPESVSAMIQVCSSAGEPTPHSRKQHAGVFRRQREDSPARRDLVAWLADDIVYFSYPNPVPSQSAWKTAARMICDGFSSGAFARQYLAILATPPREHILKTIAAPAPCDRRCRRPLHSGGKFGTRQGTVAESRPSCPAGHGPYNRATGGGFDSRLVAVAVDGHA